jgi:hypothetical protein
MKFKQASKSSCTHTNQFKPGIFPTLSNMRFGITQSSSCAARLCFHEGDHFTFWAGLGSLTLHGLSTRPLVIKAPTLHP